MENNGSCFEIAQLLLLLLLCQTRGNIVPPSSVHLPQWLPSFRSFQKMQMDENNYLIKPRNARSVPSCFVFYRLQNMTRAPLWSEPWINDRVLTIKTDRAWPPSLPLRLYKLSLSALWLPSLSVCSTEPTLVHVRCLLSTPLASECISTSMLR